MLIYPSTLQICPRLPLQKMWLFSLGQGNFDPLRLLWSETPFNRSSAQEFKLILSPPTTAPLLRSRVEAEALPSCQSCWQPAELKALSNADDQYQWLAANRLLSSFFWRWGVGSVFYLRTRAVLHFHIKKIMTFSNYLVCSCISTEAFCRDKMTACSVRLSVNQLLRCGCVATAAEYCHRSITTQQRRD